MNRWRSIRLAGFVLAILAPSCLSAAEPAKTVAQLGTNEWTAGIPGEGPLTEAQIKTWLADEKNHVALEVQLPPALAIGASGIVVPKDNPLTRAKIELGRQLYFDTRLSEDSTISCASCHHPDEGFGRHTQFGVGIRGQMGGRNSPVSFNRILSGAQFWDGRAGSLEAQAVGPIANPIEMGFTHDACVARLKGIPGYRLQFEKIFPGEGVTIGAVGKAIAAFERTLVTNDSPADHYEALRSFETQFRDLLKDVAAFKEEEPDSYAKYVALKTASEKNPVSESAKRGRELFFGQKGGCTACHVGANFTDEKYHNLGIGMQAKEPDLGRYAETKQDADRGAFKTPTVRNVTQSAPYMHDGSLKTLEEVVDWYDKGGHPNSHLSDKIKKLGLTSAEKADLVAYMKALTGPFPKVCRDRLPQ